jgi:hypothetical protein
MNIILSLLSAYRLHKGWRPTKEEEENGLCKILMT